MTKIMFKYKTVIHGQEVEVTRYESVDRTLLDELEVESEGEEVAARPKRGPRDLVDQLKDNFIWDELNEDFIYEWS